MLDEKKDIVTDVVHDVRERDPRTGQLTGKHHFEHTMMNHDREHSRATEVLHQGQAAGGRKHVHASWAREGDEGLAYGDKKDHDLQHYKHVGDHGAAGGLPGGRAVAEGDSAEAAEVGGTEGAENDNNVYHQHKSGAEALKETVGAHSFGLRTPAMQGFHYHTRRHYTAHDHVDDGMRVGHSFEGDGVNVHDGRGHQGASRHTRPGLLTDMQGNSVRDGGPQDGRRSHILAEGEHNRNRFNRRGQHTVFRAPPRVHVPEVGREQGLRTQEGGGTRDGQRPGRKHYHQHTGNVHHQHNMDGSNPYVSGVDGHVILPH